jgi:cytosine deaminase
MKARSGVSIDLSALHLNGRTVSLTLAEGRIAAITPVEKPARAVVLALPIDPHVHLDKTFTIQRCRPTKPGLFGAIEAMAADVPGWTESDILARGGLALAEAQQNGIQAMRTHVDWVQPGVPLAWSVLGELAQDWQDRLHLQRAALVPLDLLGDVDLGPAIAAQVARNDAILGCFVYGNADMDAKLARVFTLADHHGLRLDFHVDEGLDPQARGFDSIVALTARHKMSGRVLCGHACALAVRPEAEVARVLDAAAAAGVALTVLPSTNLHLQDMQPGRSPRLRGLAPLQELRAAGVCVLLGADNVADPFYPHGSYDQIEVLRLACLAAHLNAGEWLDAITTAPAQAMGLPSPSLAVGAPADFILIEGADWDAALRSARVPRQIIRPGLEHSLGKVAA